MNYYEITAEEWLEIVADPLAKSINPEKLTRFVKASSLVEGGALVDHRPHLRSHPASMIDEVGDYRKRVLESSDKVKLLRNNTNGVSKKVIVGLPHAQTGPMTVNEIAEALKDPYSGDYQKFMLKPYHEKLPAWFKRSYGKYPILGWAEMTTQDIFHAAKLGHVHHKVHTSEHPLGVYGSHPLLVVHMTPGMDPVGDIGPRVYGRDVTSDARKIGILDFLTNNLDRHAGNLLSDGDKILAIDHGRNFQYCNNYFTKWENKSKSPVALEDTIMPYLHGGPPMHPGGLTLVDDPLRRSPEGLMDAYRPILEEWWPEHSDAIEEAFNRNLPQIKDEKVAQHLVRNFQARKAFLDQIAEFGLDNFGENWHSMTVPLYLPHHTEKDYR